MSCDQNSKIIAAAQDIKAPIVRRFRDVIVLIKSYDPFTTPFIKCSSSTRLQC